jgi:wyosine [tRNA(Phe)-imidazoG37] synthetase (radical SAM superfamily)
MANLPDMKALVFDSVPSRRFRRCLGTNNIQPETCTYSCVYCIVGKTTNITIYRQAAKFSKMAAYRRVEQNSSNNICTGCFYFLIMYIVTITAARIISVS